MRIIYKLNLNDVDWNEMKETLSQDKFDNGRNPEQLMKSFENSHSTCIAYADNRIIGTARVLSDGICNAYLVDVWTLTEFRGQGIARKVIDKLLDKLPGKHVYTLTDNVVDFYKKIGFKESPTGLEKVIGQWLVNE